MQLATKVPLTNREHVFLGNGQGWPIKSIGFVSFPSSFNYSNLLHLNHMLFVPNITKNLVSVCLSMIKELFFF